MKRFFQKFIPIAAACLALAGCEEKPSDSIILSDSSVTVTQNPEEVKVIVSSSGAWTLHSAETYGWAVPSALKGIDGDIVTFSVAENLEANRTALFTFTCGQATADFTIESIAGEKPHLSFISDAEVEVGHEAGNFEVVLYSTLGHKCVRAVVDEAAQEWLLRDRIKEGSNEKEARMTVTYKALEGVEDRKGSIAFLGDGMEESVTLSVTQKAERQIVVEQELFKVEPEGGKISVPVHSNVKYEVSIQSGEGTGWISHDGLEDGKETFTVEAIKSGKRSATVTLTQTDAAAGTEPLKEEFQITQKGALVAWAADMSDCRLYPAWPENPDRPEDFCPATIEALVYFKDLSKLPVTLFGVEDKFLLLVKYNWGLPTLQVMLPPRNGRPVYYNCSNLTPDTWYHIAFTFEQQGTNQWTGKLYLNGSKSYEITLDDSNHLAGLPFARTYHEGEPEIKGSVYHNWWYGYSQSYGGFNGLMTEFRMWNKVLDEKDFAAEDHFYDVDPHSEGLLTYWKFTEGEGGKVADRSESADKLDQDLSGQMNVSTVPVPGIKWVPVDLPLEK